MTDTPVEKMDAAAIRAMIDNLREGVLHVGTNDHNEELYDIDGASDSMGEAADALEELLAARAALRHSGDGWQPIETAPTNGRRIDLLMDNGRVQLSTRWGEDEDAEYGDRVPGWVDDVTGKFVRGEDEAPVKWRICALTPPLNPVEGKQ